jgi:hypothetical protein
MGYARAKELNTELCLNISNLREGGFELDKLDLPIYGVSKKFHNSYKIKNRFIKRIWMLSTLRRHYYEKEFGYQAETKNRSLRNFHGYFQSVEYFQKYIEEIVQYVQKKKNPSMELSRYLEVFQTRRIVAVHVRRGDYLGLDDYHGVLPMNYYQEALKKFPEDKFHVAVFSNDIDLARLHFPSNYIFIGPSDLPSAAENLVLMSSASGIIGANSTLSLWAALLMNERSELKVFPEPWFKTTSIDTSNLVPAGYSRVNVSY